MTHAKNMMKPRDKFLLKNLVDAFHTLPVENTNIKAITTQVFRSRQQGDESL
jgi:hypothetical protein